MITEAHVEFYVGGRWLHSDSSAMGKAPGEAFEWEPMPQRMTIPEALEQGRSKRRYELQCDAVGNSAPSAPVRVVDSSGAVVQQWGTP